MWLAHVVVLGLFVVPTLAVATVLTIAPGSRVYETGVVFAALASVSVALLWLEQRVPAVEAWRDGWRQLPLDLAHGVWSGTAGTAGARIALFGAVAALGGGGLDLWPDRWPLLAQLVPAVIVSDLGMYALHRASHRFPWLWRLHAVHHSAEVLYTGATVRVHPVYVGLSVLCATGPILLLGAPPPLFALLSTFVGVAGLVQHANLGLDFGAYRWLLATADAHRWHHAVDGGAWNFGNTLCGWDRLFGTWRVPAGLPDRVGLGEPYPQTYFAQLARPFAREPAREVTR
ncbi:MAG: sterol desaturase family protein [Myxococcota bacterium]